MPHIPLILIGVYTAVKAVTATVVWKRYRQKQREQDHDQPSDPR